MTDRIGVVGSVSQERARLRIFAPFTSSYPHRVMSMPGCERQFERIAKRVRFDVKLGGESSSTPPQLLRRLPPLRGRRACCGHMSTHDTGVHTQPLIVCVFCQEFKYLCKYASFNPALKAFVDGVPLPQLGREHAPCCA